MTRTLHRILFAFALSIFSLQALGQTETTYPLYAVAAGKPPYTPEDMQIIAKNFHYMRGRADQSVIEKIHQINPDFRFIEYYSTGTFGLTATAKDTEKLYRQEIAMFGVGKLASAINASQTTFRLQPEVEGNSISLKKSTTTADFTIDIQNYVTWVRIDNEFMKITDFDAATGKISVIRGFSGTAAASHDLNAMVFSPIYIGASYPGGTDHKKRIRYAVDITSQIARKLIIDHTYDAVTKKHYDGLWLDTFNARSFNHKDMFGKNVELVWDFNKKEYSTKEIKRTKQEIRLNYAQNQLRDKLGEWPFFLANRMGPDQYWPGKGDTRRMLLPTDLKPRPLDGYCIESFAGELYSPNQKPHYRKGKVWRSHVMMLMDATQRGLAALPRASNGGPQSLYLEPAGPIRDDFENYAYASFLMAVERDSKIMLGIPAYYYYEETKTRKAWVHPRYYLPIGAPIEKRQPADIDQYIPAGHVTYMRRFTNGLVLVNPNDKDDLIKLDDYYFDPDIGKMINSINMRSLSGKILLKISPDKLKKNNHR